MDAKSGTVSPEEESPTYNRVSRSLQTGLALSVGFMVAGLLVLALRKRNEPTHVLLLPALAGHVARGDPAGLLDTGIVLLFLTPLGGVIVALLEYLRRRDWQFVAVTLLLLSFVGVGFLATLR